MLSEIASMPMIPQLWSWAYTNHYNFLSSPLGYSAYIIVFYLVAALPWLIVDYFRLFSKHKMQKDVYFTLSELLVAFGQYWITEIFVYLPLTYLSHTLGFTVPVHEAPPTVGTFAYEVLLSLALVDFAAFAMHSILHTKFLYKHIHSIHHQYRTPFSFATQAHHPVEAVLMGLSITCPTMFVCQHIMTQWFTFAFVMGHGVWSHSGYDFGLYKLGMGMIGFPAYHDSHHLLTTKNMGAYTTFWDRLFGTFATPPCYVEKSQETEHPAKLTKTPSRRHVSFFGKPTTRRVARS